MQHTASLQSHLAQAPDATSNGRLWAGVAVNWHDWRGAGNAVSPELDHDFIAMRTSGVARLTQRRDGRTHTGQVSAGSISLHPRGMESRWQWDAPGAIVLMRMPQQMLIDAAAATTIAAPSRCELQNCFATRDTLVERIAMQMLDELRMPEHPAQPYITQSLSYALAAHLTQRFNSAPAPLERQPASLHPRALQRVQDYIRANLHEHIDLQTLADLANVSRFHFARMFRAGAGVSAMRYLESARMLRAQELIRGGALPLGHIAMLVGYADPSHFSRRFRHFCGQTPSVYAQALRGRPLTR